MKSVDGSQFHQEISDALSTVAFAGERIAIKRHGKRIAGIVPIADLELLEAIEDRVDLALAKKALKEKGAHSLGKGEEGIGAVVRATEAPAHKKTGARGNAPVRSRVASDAAKLSRPSASRGSRLARRCGSVAAACGLPWLRSGESARGPHSSSRPRSLSSTSDFNAAGRIPRRRTIALR